MTMAFTYNVNAKLIVALAESGEQLDTIVTNLLDRGVSPEDIRISVEPALTEEEKKAKLEELSGGVIELAGYEGERG